MAKIRLNNRNTSPRVSNVVYNKFYKNLTRSINANKVVQRDEFSAKFHSLSDHFEKEKKTDEFTKLSKGLMSFLVHKKMDDLAGIVCSVLIKINEDNPDIAEDLAIRGIAIARRMHDPIHIASRACSLNKILRFREPGSERHIKYLRIENKALKDICKNYDNDVTNRFKTISSKPAPLINYEVKLCGVKLDIATYTLLKDRQSSLYEYEQAANLLRKFRNEYSKNKEIYSDNIQQAIDKLEKRAHTLGSKIDSLM